MENSDALKIQIGYGNDCVNKSDYQDRTG